MDSRGSVRSGVVCFGCCCLQKALSGLAFVAFVLLAAAGAFWREEEEGAGEKTKLLREFWRR